MYIINEDGKGLLPLPTLSGGDYDPKWSPDGKYIVFTSLRNSGRPQLYVLNLEDNSVRAVIGEIHDRFSGGMVAGWQRNCIHHDAAQWSTNLGYQRRWNEATPVYACQGFIIFAPTLFLRTEKTWSTLNISLKAVSHA